MIMQYNGLSVGIGAEIIKQYKTSISSKQFDRYSLSTLYQNIQLPFWELFFYYIAIGCTGSIIVRFCKASFFNLSNFWDDLLSIFLPLKSKREK